MPRKIKIQGISVRPKWDWSDDYKKYVRRRDKELRESRSGTEWKYRDWLKERA